MLPSLRRQHIQPRDGFPSEPPCFEIVGIESGHWRCTTWRASRHEDMVDGKRMFVSEAYGSTPMEALQRAIDAAQRSRREGAF